MRFALLCSRTYTLPAWLCLLAGVASCAGGSGGGTAPPSNFSYPTAPAFTLNQTITPLVPTISGQVTSYTVSPALPQGLSVNQGDGAIAGTPLALSPQTTYTVTASNQGGSANATVSIVVAAPQDEITYPSSAYSFSVGVPAQAIGPIVKAGSVQSWSISPALPAGLTFDMTTGVISGTPTAAAASGTYVVTAHVSGGESSTSLTLAVASPLFDLGHASRITLVRMSNNAVLSRDYVNHWVLWNYSTGAQLAANGVPCPQTTELISPDCQLTPVDLAGSIAIIQTSTGLEVRSATSGQVLAEIVAAPAWWKLAADGSYICAGSAQGLTAWSPSGAVLFTIAGNYTSAVAYAAPAQIEVAVGPAGANVIQTIAVPTGTATLSRSFQGQFQSWFLDGSRFFSAVLSGSGPSTWWVYTPAAVQQDVAVLNTQSLQGLGNWYWGVPTSHVPPTIGFAAVGSGGTVTSTFPAGPIVASPPSNTLGLTFQSTLPTTNYQFMVINLSGATPTSTTYTVPSEGELDFLNGIQYAATTSSSG